MVGSGVGHVAGVFLSASEVVRVLVWSVLDVDVERNGVWSGHVVDL